MAFPHIGPMEIGLILVIVLIVLRRRQIAPSWRCPRQKHKGVS